MTVGVDPEPPARWSTRRSFIGAAAVLPLAAVLVDAFIWVTTPGESDGTCNGGPPAGQFWTENALGPARN